jgi:predicted O-methyltransferase YrrM
VTPEESIAWKPTLPGGSTDTLPAMRDILLPLVPSGGTYLEVGSFFGRSLTFVGQERPDLRLISSDQWENEWQDAGETLPVGPDRERRDRYGGTYEAFLATLQEHAPELFAGMKTLDIGTVMSPDDVLFKLTMPPVSRLTVLRGPSQRMLRLIPDASVDLCFLDGDHTRSGLLADIEEAKRITKPGGCISGHDFTQVSWGGDVQAAVRDAFLFKVGARGYLLAPWPVERMGWERGHSSVWFVTKW